MKILILILAGIVLASNVSADDARDAQIRSVIQAHERLKAAVAEIEGSIEISHTNWAGKLPPYLKGDFSRGKHSFRASFQIWNPKTRETEWGDRQLVARDREHSYQLLRASADAKMGVLRVRDSSYPGVKMLADGFESSIDSLWGASGRPIADIMQQPNAAFEISDADGIPGALIITVSDAGAEARYTLDPSHDYACRRAVVESENQLGAEMSIEFTTLPDGKLVPSQLHESGFNGSQEYRRETKLVLSSPKEPLPTEFSDDSFEDFGLNYVVAPEDPIPQGHFVGTDWNNSSAPRPRIPVIASIAIVGLVAVGLGLLYRACRAH